MQNGGLAFEWIEHAMIELHYDYSCPTLGSLFNKHLVLRFNVLIHVYIFVLDVRYRCLDSHGYSSKQLGMLGHKANMVVLIRIGL